MRSKKELPEKYDFEEEIKGGSKSNFLTLHNDEVHSFDYVIETLIDVCDHDMYQAEQCAFIVHYKGKCDIKKGTYELLHPLWQALYKWKIKNLLFIILPAVLPGFLVCCLPAITCNS